MKKFRFTIGNKILAGFILVILFFAINAAVIVVTVNQNEEIIDKSSEVIEPTVSALKEFRLIIIRSKMLSTNWVYLQTNTEDKEALKLLHEVEYPDLKDELVSLKNSWEDESQKEMLDSIFQNMDIFLGVQQEIMTELVTFEDYEDPLKKFTMVELVESSIIPQTNALMDQIAELTATKEQEDTASDNLIQESSSRLSSITITLVAVITVISILIALYMSRSITNPINYIKEIILKLSSGELPEEKDRKFGNDEIGEMAVAVDKLVNGLKSTSYFAEDIGKGNYEASFEPLSENDVLGNALLDMRDNLKKVAEEDKMRSWATEGLARFGDILRRHQDNLEKLSDEIISNLVKYMKANQGGLFILNEDDKEDAHLNLTACYAWDKKKYLDQKIYEGEGLTGQAWLEKDTVYITEVPDEYVNITSGLGGANPKSILIVPLKVNDEVYGVIEVASFQIYEKFEIEFVEKIAESIASTISSVKINERTQKLLEESTELTEQMRSQEEEMRQNMEELQATQEEMQRNQRETEIREGIINATNVMLELDSSFTITSTNDLVKSTFGLGEDDLSGKRIDNFIENIEGLQDLKTNLMAGNVWSGAISFKNNRNEGVQLFVSAGPAEDISMEEKKYLLYCADVSQLN
ncbi:MAG: GAF domain-containing protein [Bacteroidota bacterium]